MVSLLPLSDMALANPTQNGSLRITKASDAAGPVNHGATLNYTISVENIGASPLTGVSIQSILPAGLTLVPGSVSASLSPIPPPYQTVTIATTGSGSFTVPAGVTQLQVEAWGGGGGGASSGTNNGGGAGGGGAYARLNSLAVVPGATLEYFVGPGGGLPGAGNPGRAGQATWFSQASTLLAQGGSGGGAGAISAAGLGGGVASASVGDVTWSGGNGGAGSSTGKSSTRAGGGGGGSALATGAGGNGGNGGNDAPGAGGTGSGNGGNGGQSGILQAQGGFIPGGGGGGCGGAGAGAGGDGRLIITYPTPSHVGTTGNHPNLATGWTLDPGSVVTVVYQAILDNTAMVTQITTTATASSVEAPAPLAATCVDTVNGATLGGTVWNDANGDGIQDAGESGLDGVAVTLRKATDDMVLVTTTTSGGGLYHFAGLPPANYRVEFASLAGYIRTKSDQGENEELDSDADPATGLTANVTLAAGQTNSSIDAGYAVIAPSLELARTGNLDLSLAGSAVVANVGDEISYAFIVTNTGNVALEGITVSDPKLAILGGPIRLEPGERDSTSFTATYTLTQADIDARSFISKASTAATSPLGDIVTATHDDTRVLDTGVMLGDFVWYDADVDGMQDSGEIGINGVTVRLLDAGDDSVVATATTSGGGAYGFPGQAPGAYKVEFVLPAGYSFSPQNADSVGVLTGAANSDADATSGRTAVFTLAAGENTANVDAGIYQPVPCPPDWYTWKAQNPGQTAGGNPDGDGYDNFAEFALAMPHASGRSGKWLDGTAWVVRPSSINPGVLEGVFVRPVDAADNVTYVLQYAANLGSPTVWLESAIQPDQLAVSSRHNGDCTETVTIHNLADFTGLGPGQGFVRIKAVLDDHDVPGTVNHTSFTEVEGWTETDFDLVCQSYHVPYQRETLFTGTVAGVSGQTLAFSGENLDNLLQPGAAHYIEVRSGENEGHRFDVVSASGNAITLALDDELHAATPPFHTRTGVLPADLVGDAVILRRHWTLNELFPPAAFSSDAVDYEADQVQVFSGNRWQFYWLFDDNGTPRWVEVADSSNRDKGALVIPPGQGMFFHNRKLSKTLLGYGEVRANQFIRPLAVGFNLVGGGYPVIQSPNSTGGRAMNATTGFFGSTDVASSDAIGIWRSDALPAEEGYVRYFLLDDSPVDRWVQEGQDPAASVDAAPLFQHNRAVQIRTNNGVDSHIHPVPWSP